MSTQTLLPGFRPSLGKPSLLALLFIPMLTHAQGDIRSSTVSNKGVERSTVTTTAMTVTAIDLKARTVDLKAADGSETTMAVSDEVKRLDEVKVGDQLNIGYMEAVGLEFRAPTAEELKEPYQVLEGTGRADKSEAPAGAQVRTIRAVVTVEGISRLLNALTVRGPRGNYVVIEVDPTTVKWEELRIGQTMVGTYTEALVMSIEPVTKN